MVYSEYSSGKSTLWSYRSKSQSTLCISCLWLKKVGYESEGKSKLHLVVNSADSSAVKMEDKFPFLVFSCGKIFPNETFYLEFTI